MANIKILHNPRCSKSRETLKLIKEKGIDPEIVEYLNYPLTTDQLKDILKKLKLKPKDILRKKEAVYKDLTMINPAPTDDDLINWMSTNPVLIERPIVIKDDEAIMGRPPENVHKIL